MSEPIVIREYARLTTLAVEPNLDQATVTPSAFDWLCRLASTFRKSGAQLLELEGTRWLRMDNFVGILETPCGTTLEILPKHHEADTSEDKARALLIRMIQAALDLPVRQVGCADLSLFSAPLSEWVRHQFLLALEHLIKRGVRFDYLRIEEEQRHARGQLDVIRQLHQRPERQHYFHTRHDVFSLDFCENRLIKSALLRVATSTQDPINWRLSHELLLVLGEVPPSRAIHQDFKDWRCGRLMAHYAPILPWCQLVLGQHLPMAVRGEWHGMSLLFPMEKLFERFVGAALRRQFAPSVRIRSQRRESHLCQHQGEGFFELRPDFLIERDHERIVADAKWKRLDSHARGKKYGISQGDFYQLFAYGHKYIPAQQCDKELLLIYPRTESFSKPLPAFSFTAGMTLWVLPFELGARAGEERLVLCPDMDLSKWR